MLIVSDVGAAPVPLTPAPPRTTGARGDRKSLAAHLVAAAGAIVAGAIVAGAIVADGVECSCAQQAAARFGCPSCGARPRGRPALMSRMPQSLTKGAGSTSCSAAQASFCSSEKQQQCSLQPAALWQPQLRCMHGNGTLTSLVGATGNGNPTEIAQYASTADTTKPWRARLNEILLSRRMRITIKDRQPNGRASARSSATNLVAARRAVKSPCPHFWGHFGVPVWPSRPSDFR